MQKLKVILCLVAAMAIPIGKAGAQDWPRKPITVILPFAPGPVDSNIRMVAEKVGKILGQPLIIDNKPGAGMRLGTAALMHALPDGYTIGVLTSANGAIIPALEPNALLRDPVRDLTLISLAFDGAFALLVRSDLPVTNVPELVRLAKSKPNSLNYGSSGVGTAGHLWFEVFQSATNTRFVHVPYKGEAPALQDLIGGQTQAMIGSTTLARRFMDAGQIKALAVGGPARLPTLSGVPTFKEAGLQSMTATGWVGFVAPPGIPPDVTGKLVRAFHEALSSSELRAQLEAGGNSVRNAGPDEFAKAIKAEMEQFRRVATAQHISLQ